MNNYFIAHETPFSVPEHKPRVYSTWDTYLCSLPHQFTVLWKIHFCVCNNFLSFNWKSFKNVGIVFYNVS